MSERVAAVPAYVGDDVKDTDDVGKNFKDAPPGHRFELYFSIWNEHSWQICKEQKGDALKETFSLQAHMKMLDAIIERQKAIFSGFFETNRLNIDAKSISPFATGMGIEHPLENGFSFLKPYGLPYLPGSGIKGVLRKAAEELSNDLYGEGNKGWDQAAIDILFGREVEDKDTETKRTQGALTFWDVFPKPFGNTLAMEIMTPHYSDYYQEKQTPHDAGQPNPIPFLVVPAGSEFSFYVTCNPKRLGNLPLDWKPLLQAAFEHAFAWLGFGAKTAVGYGAITTSSKAQSSGGQQNQDSGLREQYEQWDKLKRIQYRRGQGKQSLQATNLNGETAIVQKSRAEEVWNALPETVRKKLESQSELNNPDITLKIEKLGNKKEIVGVVTSAEKS